MAGETLGTSFPPRSWREIEAYDQNELLAGYIDWTPDDIKPGPNRTPAYQWGWSNQAYDHGVDDGYGALRVKLIHERREAIARHTKDADQARAGANGGAHE